MGCAMPLVETELPHLAAKLLLFEHITKNIWKIIYIRNSQGFPKKTISTACEALKRGAAATTPP